MDRFVRMIYALVGLLVILMHTMFTSPRHLAVVYMYIIMLDMYFCSLEDHI